MNAILLSILMAVALGEPGGAADSQQAGGAEQIQAEVAEAADFARKEADLWQLYRDGADRTKLELRPDPILRWSNPAVGRVYGSVFVWTSADGRPAAVASFYRYFAPFVQRTAEFVSLSPHGLNAEREEQKLWTPAAGRVRWQRLEGAPAPRESSKQRLPQMRRLAREFVPELTDRRVVLDGTQQQLRLMDQPVYQYRAGSDGLLDGALFAFVVGTDPEVLLLLEAREVTGGREWHYAFARMNRDAMRVRYQDREVWNVPHLEKPWTDPKHDYFIVEISKLP